MIVAFAWVDQATAQFDTLSVGVRRYILVNEEEALDVIESQNQELIEYADTVTHLNGVLGLLVDSLGGAEAALYKRWIRFSRWRSRSITLGIRSLR